ncbi:juvenile hormone esterase-like [Chrysoperla carnea]|uniref:juvenile hormone esterase-like n=1 Tax=Chrysoperla carnea TaxID=189513 RepID=UPI001D082ED2|nr:juvenile hormone esterase-like [Chrysoperla carnea]
MILFLTTICLIVGINAFPKLDGESVIAETKQGKLRGRIDLNYWNEPFFTFEGVPYAKPPVGELRFKAPQPPLPWKEEIRDAVKPGPPCVQFIGEGSEDCLLLNIHSKMTKEKQISKELRPVMVWIHGGAFKAGSISNNLYGPEFLVHENIVLVKIQYRLNVLGFLSLTDDEGGVSGNAGLKDQVMALKWVQKNIENFGGDPNRVTIFGQSAGGASTHLLNLSPMTKGLFHRVISQSGCGLNEWLSSKITPKQNYYELFGCNSTDSNLILECLQRVTPVEKLIKMENELLEKTDEGFLVVIENSTKEEQFLPSSVEKLIKDGSFNQIPFMAGYVPQEGATLYYLQYEVENGNNPLKENFIPENIVTYLSPEEEKNLNEKIRQFYFKNRNSTDEILYGYLNYLTDSAIIERLYTATKWHALKSTAPVYYYKFNYDTSLNLRLKMFPQNYVTHDDELKYLFTNIKTPKNLSDTSIEMQGIKRMIKIWARFAETGNPNPLDFDDEKYTNDAVEWKPVTSDKFSYLAIQPTFELEENPEEERMQFWESVWADLKMN